MFGNPELFDATGSANPIANLTGSLTTVSVSVNNAAAFTFAGHGGLSGNTGLSITGSGTLNFNTPNSHSGLNSLNGGTLQWSGNQSAATGGFALSIPNSATSASIAAGKSVQLGAVPLVDVATGNSAQTSTSMGIHRQHYRSEPRPAHRCPQRKPNPRRSFHLETERTHQCPGQRRLRSHTHLRSRQWQQCGDDLLRHSAHPALASRRHYQHQHPAHPWRHAHDRSARAVQWSLRQCQRLWPSHPRGRRTDQNIIFHPELLTGDASGRLILSHDGGGIIDTNGFNTSIDRAVAVAAAYERGLLQVD